MKTASPITIPQPPHDRWRVPLVLVAVVLGLLGVGAALLWRAESAVNQVAMSSEPKAVTAQVATQLELTSERRLVGHVEPWMMARVGPQLVSAYVASVLVRPGDRVARNDVLATLDCKGATVATRAVAAQARALEETQKAIASEAARVEQLSEGGFVSANELEQRRARQASNHAQLEALRAQLAGKSLAVDDCVLRAPFTGEVGARLLDPGAFVRPGDTLVTLVDRHMLRIVADAPEADATAVQPHTSVRLRLLATGEELSGTITRRSPSAHPATRTVHFEIDLPERATHAPIGTTAEIFVPTAAPRPSVRIPLDAAKVRGSAASVYVIEDDVARLRNVTVLGERGGALFVDPQALPAGSLVVSEGRGTLRDGDHVVAKVDER